MPVWPWITYEGPTKRDFREFLLFFLMTIQLDTKMYNYVVDDNWMLFWGGKSKTSNLDILLNKKKKYKVRRSE